MSRPIEQALTSLIPRHPGSLPPELIELASSLLAQSRSKISNLRADEEIGRTYACANLACERLKTTLNLPSIEPRPPCPPKIYKKLYGHFDQFLTTASSRRRRRSSNQNTPVKTLTQKLPPSRAKGLESFRSNRTPKRGLQFGDHKKQSLPKWVGPAIRKICADFDAGKAVPHVWAGVESVLFLPCPKEAAEGEEEGADHRDKMEGKIAALVASICFFVVAALESKKTSKKELFEDKKRMWMILRGLKEDEGVAAKIGKDGWDEWEDLENMALKLWMAQVDEWIDVVISGGWLEMEWRINIVDGSGASGTVAEEDEDEDGKEDDDEEEELNRASKRLRRTGLGTMMQAKFDYLSDEKRQAYAIWKKAVLARLDEIDAERMGTAED